MTETELDTILSTLRKHGVVSAEVPTKDAFLRVVFGPETGAPLPVGDDLSPGGWKSPDRLDRDPLADERSVP